MSKTLAESGVRFEGSTHLVAELADTRLLQAISAELITEGNAEALYEKIIDAAMMIMRSDFASMQMLHAERGEGELELLAFRGFSEQAARFWKWVRSDSSSTCGMALRQRQRVITADVEKCCVIASSSDLEVYLSTGIRSVQTTPLLSRDGKLVGMLSTHWRHPHEPSERDLRLLDILVRQAADLIERNHAEAALRASAAASLDANRRQNDFLAMLAHELRNPLAPIRNAAQILRQAGGDVSTVESVAGVLERQIGLLVRLVEDLQDASRVGQGKMELRRERTELATIIRQAAEFVRPMYEQSKQQLVVSLPERPVSLYADPARLTQAIGNLLTNASKFTDRGGHVRVQAEANEHEAIIRLHDDGIGIAPEQLPRVFDMFAQVDTTVDRANSGLGIGLALVKSLVEMHGGTVAARSAGLGKGSEFTISLPLFSS